MELPLESLNFVDLMELNSFDVRVAERFWERAKLEGRKEFESGHLAANITFPVGYISSFGTSPVISASENLLSMTGIRKAALKSP